MLKFVNGRNSELSQLTEIINYVRNPEKNSGNLYASVGLRINEAAEDMKTVKVLKNKTEGRQYIHFILSFDENVDVLVAHRIGRKVLRYHGTKFQILMAVHNNTRNVHCHFIVNTVGKENRKFSQSKEEMLKFREFVNNILEAEGLDSIGAEQEEISFDCMDEEDTSFLGNPDEDTVSVGFYASENCDFEELYGNDNYENDGYGNSVYRGYDFTPDDALDFDEEAFFKQAEANLTPAMKKLTDEEMASLEGQKLKEQLYLNAQKEVKKIQAERAREDGELFNPMWHFEA